MAYSGPGGSGFGNLGCRGGLPRGSLTENTQTQGYHPRPRKKNLLAQTKILANPPNIAYTLISGNGATLEDKAMATAYDYNRQQWVTGSEAAVLLRKQYEEERDILTGPDAQNYLNMIGSQDTPERALARLAAKYGMED